MSSACCLASDVSRSLIGDTDLEPAPVSFSGLIITVWVVAWVVVFICSLACRRAIVTAFVPLTATPASFCGLVDEVRHLGWRVSDQEYLR